MRLRDTTVRIDGPLPLTSREPVVDLNYLYHRHGISLLLADQAQCAASRSAHLELAAGYAVKISDAIRANEQAAL